MNPREMREHNQSLDTGPRKYLAPADAAQAIHVIRTVLDRLDEPMNAQALRTCLYFAQEALWAAAYPDDPSSMLVQVAQQAENAMG